MKKIYTLCLSAMAAMGMQAQNGITIPSKLSETMVLGMSTDGAYLCGTDISSRSFVYDVKGDSVLFGESIDGQGAEYRRVSCSGTAVGFNGPAMMQSLEATTTTNYGEGIVGSLFNDITSDGTVAVGFCYDEEYKDKPFYFKGGKFYYLPIPTTEELGFAQEQGARCIAVSDDASIIIGSVTDNLATYPMIMWKRGADGNYTLDLTCKDYFEPEYGDKPYCEFQPVDISSNGKWVTLVLQANGAYDRYPGRYNVETGELELIDASGINGEGTMVDCLPSSISNDGTIIGITGNGMFAPRYGFYAKSGEPITLLSKAFEAAPELAAYDTNMFHIPMGISDDGTIISGFARDDEGMPVTYIFNINEYTSTGITPAEVAKGDTKGKKIFTADGKMVQNMQRGLNIVKTDARANKVLLR